MNGGCWCCGNNNNNERGNFDRVVGRLVAGSINCPEPANNGVVGLFSGLDCLQNNRKNHREKPRNVGTIYWARLGRYVPSTNRKEDANLIKLLIQFIFVRCSDSVRAEPYGDLPTTQVYRNDPLTSCPTTSGPLFTPLTIIFLYSKL